MAKGYGGVRRVATHAPKRSVGGGGGTGNLFFKKKSESQPNHAVSKETLTGKNVAAFIRKQINVDISKYQNEWTKRWSGRNFTVVDWKRMPRNDRAEIMRLSQKGYFALAEHGAWTMAIITKKNKY